jgi:hypothetical protein
MGQRTRCDGASEYSIGIGHRQWLRPRSARSVSPGKIIASPQRSAGDVGRF